MIGDMLPLPSTDPRAGISLGRAPNPGLARRTQTYEIAARIKAAGKGVEWPKSILVRRGSQPLNSAEIHQTVLQAFLDQFPDADIHLLDVEIPDLKIETGDVQLHGALPQHFDPRAPISVRLDIRGRSFSRTVYIRVSARIELIQPVLRVNVLAHSEILPEYVKWVMAPLETDREVPKSFDTFKGMA